MTAMPRTGALAVHGATRLEPAMSRARASAWLRAAFANAGLESPALDARVLIRHGLGINAAALAMAPEEPIGAEGARRIAAYAARRLAREPVARIVGGREFWGMPFALNASTLVPRPESETLVTAVLDRLRESGRRDEPLSILDLGTGSGCLLVALLAEMPAAAGLGLDRSPEAAAMARFNAEANGIGRRALVAVSDWAAAVGRRFDVVVSNPPYVAAAMIGTLAPEVRDHDPRLALDGGRDGLDACRAIAADVDRLLVPGGLVAFEVGAGQADHVAALLCAHALADVRIAHDLSGTGRVVTATR